MNINMITGSLAKDLAKARRYLPQYMRNLTDSVSEEMRDETKKLTPTRTGLLKSTIETIDTERRFTGTGIQVWSGGAKSDLRRASYTEYDTAPHIIRAKTSAGLQFFDRRKGVYVVREEVFHPGTTGVHMFSRAADIVDSTMAARGEAMLLRWKVKNGL